MAKIVQILGTAPSVCNTPPMAAGVERWASNHPRTFRIRFGEVWQGEWSRWFNVHSFAHIHKTYPSGYAWYQKQDGRRPMYFRDGADPTIPGSARFPGAEIRQFFSLDGGVTPFPYFTSSLSWFLAMAGYEGFDRVELWGFELRRDHQYAFERPCAQYWIQRLRAMGIDVFLPPYVQPLGDPGDPATYTGPIYGYQTTAPFTTPEAVKEGIQP